MKLTNIKLKYGDKIIYDNFNIEIPENKITCILGPSGCGKTSLLNIIAGIVKYEGNVDKKSDEISFVFQNPLLIDHLTVYKNVEFVLKQAVKNKKERAVIIENILNKVINVETGTLVMLINIPILIIGTWKFGFRFILSTH